jgi:hypothetical protein
MGAPGSLPATPRAGNEPGAPSYTWRSSVPEDERRASAADARAADFRAGAVPYFSRLRAIDLLGRADAHVARLPAHAGATVPGHNKFDFSYSLGRLEPDYVVANFALPVDPERMRWAARGDYGFTGALYWDPIFRAHCLEHPLPVPTWRSIFVCDWSAELARAGAWPRAAVPR